MQLESKNSPIQSPATVAKRLLVTAWRLINNKLVLWLFIVWLVFDIRITTDSFSIKFSKPVCSKVSGLFIATKGGN